jgi:hypothetical protein
MGRTEVLQAASAQVVGVAGLPLLRPPGTAAERSLLGASAATRFAPTA